MTSSPMGNVNAARPGVQGSVAPATGTEHNGNIQNLTVVQQHNMQARQKSNQGQTTGTQYIGVSAGQQQTVGPARQGVGMASQQQQQVLLQQQAMQQQQQMNAQRLGLEHPQQPQQAMARLTPGQQMLHNQGSTMLARGSPTGAQMQGLSSGGQQQQVWQGKPAQYQQQQHDVGALKQAHAGVALLNAIPPAKASNESATDSQTDSTDAASTPVVNGKPKRKSGVSGSQGLSGAITPVEGGAASKISNPDSDQLSPSGRWLTPLESKRKELKKLIDEMNAEGDGTASVMKLGDASMAAPFTAKHSFVWPTTDIIRQRRSTLVTTLQMFKILGLNCLATAYVLSVMYLDGVKLGDMQATISGLFTAIFFLFISHARPLDTLLAQRPHPNIFSPSVVLSLLGQFAIHITFLIRAVKGAQAFMPDKCVEPDSEFTPLIHGQYDDSGQRQPETSLFPEARRTWKPFKEIQKLLIKTNVKTVGDVMTPSPLVVCEQTNLEDAAK